MYKLYGMAGSSNCYKVKLLLEHLAKPYRWVEIDILKGESRDVAFLSMNPTGKVPVLEIAPDSFLWESNAILFYLADPTRYLPADDFPRAQAMQWLFFEQYSLEPAIALARFIGKFLADDHPRNAELPNLQERGNAALAVLEQHLAAREFLVEERYSIADIALYATTHCAAEGGFDIARFPAIGAWLERVRAQPRHVPMEAPPVACE